MRIIAITDNGGRTADRYSVYIANYGANPDYDPLQFSILGLSDDCDSPQGFSQFGGYTPPKRWIDKLDEDCPDPNLWEDIVFNDLEFLGNPTCRDDGLPIQWRDLPMNVRNHIAERLLL